ncbi:MAG: hypothetical protein NC218_07355 [Acetobacter sp.]|nr:hypothetical protein [Acetobacter sp.]
MVVGPVGAAIICAEEAWSRFRAEKGIRDPFWDVKMKNFGAKCEKVIIRGVECTQIHTDRPDIVHLEPGELERYNDLHDKFMAAYIFSIEGYDTLCRTQYKILKDWFRPCEGPDGQCSIDCKLYYEDCSQDERTYPSEFADIFEFVKKDLEEE